MGDRFKVGECTTRQHEHGDRSQMHNDSKSTAAKDFRLKQFQTIPFVLMRVHP